MKIVLQYNRTVEEIEHEFNSVYPFLKICFFTKEEGRTSHEVDASAELIEVSGVLKEGDININSTDTV